MFPENKSRAGDNQTTFRYCKSLNLTLYIYIDYYTIYYNTFVSPEKIYLKVLPLQRDCQDLPHLFGTASLLSANSAVDKMKL